MKKIMSRWYLVIFSLLMTFAAQANNYNWSSVAIGGGGYVMGVTFHPKEEGLVYIRTDIGGAYRWDKTNNSWINLSDWIGPAESNLYGVESLAIDPNDPDVVYMAVGKEKWSPASASDILKSTDRGETWTRLGFHKLNWGNGPNRWGDERLAVDPNNSDIVYYATRYDGLWRSMDAGESWAEVNSFSATGATDLGIGFVEFDANAELSDGKSSVIYAGVYGDGLYRSVDAGENWQKIEGGPDYIADIRHIEIAHDGTVYTTFEKGDSFAKSGGVWKLATDGTWSDISPTEQGGYNGLALDPNDDNALVTTTFTGGFNSVIYRSTDAGLNWSKVDTKIDRTVLWRPSSWFGAAIADVEINPFDSDHLLFTDWYAVWQTKELSRADSGQDVIFKDLSQNHEEVVVRAIHSPQDGAALFSGLSDVCGFRHVNFDYTPYDRYSNPECEDTMSIASAIDDPNYLIRVGGNKFHGTGVGAYSTDNGVSWMEFASYPDGDARNGRAALTKDGKTILWVPEKRGGDAAKSTPYYSTDKGASWTKSAGAPDNIMYRGDLWEWEQPLAASIAVDDRFYIYHAVTGSFYRSDDAGQNFVKVNDNLPVVTEWGSLHQVKAAPVADQVWISFPGNGLYISNDAGANFTKNEQVDDAILVDFGIGATDDAMPAAYLLGTIDGQYGMYISDDLGANWRLISNDAVQFGDVPQVMEGDNQTYGRVYVGFNGRGIIYGELEGTEPLPIPEPPTSEGLIDESGLYVVKNLATGLLLTANGDEGGREWLPNFQVEEDLVNGIYSTQRWKFLPVEGVKDQYIIQSDWPGHAISTDGQETTQILQAGYQEWPSQHWLAIKVGENQFKFKAQYPDNMYLSVNTEDGSWGNIYQDVQKDDDSQIWVLDNLNEVEQRNTKPNAYADMYMAAETEILTLNVLANDSDDDGDTISIESFEYEGDGILDLIDGQFTYQAVNGFIGIDEFTYTITDGEATDTAKVSIKVEEVVNLAPSITIDMFDLEYGESLTLNAEVLGLTDPDNSTDSLMISILSGEHYQVDELTVMPADDFSGELIVNIEVTDGENIVSSTLSVMVAEKEAEETEEEVEEEVEETDSDDDKGISGGSIGFYWLLLLIGLVIRRNHKI